MTLSLLSWVLVILTILAQTTNRIATKYALFKTGPLPLTIFTNLVAGLILLPFAWNDLPHLLNVSAKELILILSAGLAWGIFGYIYNVALEKSPVSIFVIITQLQVALIVLLGVIFLQQKVTLGLVMGVILISFASVLVSYKKESRKEITVIAILLCLLTAVSGAVAVFLDSYNIHIFDIKAYAFTILMLSNVPLYFFYRPKKEDFSAIKNKMYLLIGLIFLAGYTIPLMLYRQPDVQISYVYPILRTGAIFSVIVGILLFKEKTNWVYKIIAVIIAVMGAVLVKLA